MNIFKKQGMTELRDYLRVHGYSRACEKGLSGRSLWRAFGEPLEGRGVQGVSS